MFSGTLTRRQVQLFTAVGRALEMVSRRWRLWAWVSFMLALGAFLALVTAVQPVLTLLLLAALVGLAGLTWLLRSLAPGAPWWIKASFFVVCGQLVLSYGFSNIIFIAGGVPIPLTDGVMMIGLLYSGWHVLFARERVALPPGLWVLLGWVLFCLAWHLPAGLRRDGVGAARDAMPTVQILYAIVGFVIVTLCLRAGEQGRRWLRGVLLLLGGMLAVYGLCYPISSVLISVSPRMSSLQQSVPIFGYFTSWPAMAALSLVGLALWRWQAERRGLRPGWPGRLLGVVIVLSSLMTFFLVQARIAYLFALLCAPIFLVVGGQTRQVGRMAGALLLGLSALMVIELSGLELQGRVAKLSVSGIYHHLLSLGGSAGGADRDFGGAAAGIDQRRQWREYALGLWSEGVSSEMLGIGYGYVLTDLTTGGTAGETLIVREPHNSYVTTLTRTGAVGLGIMLGLHAAVLGVCFIGYRRSYQNQPALAAAFLGALFYEVYSLLNAWGEPHFEVAHFSVPSYFIYGAVFALYAHQHPRSRLAPVLDRR